MHFFVVCTYQFRDHLDICTLVLSLQHVSLHSVIEGFGSIVI